MKSLKDIQAETPLGKANILMDEATTDEEFEVGMKLYMEHISEWVCGDKNYERKN